MTAPGPVGLGWTGTMEPTVLGRDQYLGTAPEPLLKHAPERLWCLGDSDLLSPHVVRVSIVGTRTPRPEGQARARRLARELAGRNIVVVSGLAKGIDTAAHEEAIRSPGRTIAVLGTGVDTPYPAGNRGLWKRIAEEHLVVSQFPPGSGPRRQSFPQRNRTMALLSHATVIVEAGGKSGTLHQGWEALRLNRPLFLLRSLVEGAASEAWVEEFLGYGAKTLSKLEDLLEWLPSPSGHVDEPVL